MGNKSLEDLLRKSILYTVPIRVAESPLMPWVASPVATLIEWGRRMERSSGAEDIYLFYTVPFFFALKSMQEYFEVADTIMDRWSGGSEITSSIHAVQRVKERELNLSSAFERTKYTIVSTTSFLTTLMVNRVQGETTLEESAITFAMLSLPAYVGCTVANQVVTAPKNARNLFDRIAQSPLKIGVAVGAALGAYFVADLGGTEVLKSTADQIKVVYPATLTAIITTTLATIGAGLVHSDARSAWASTAKRTWHEYVTQDVTKAIDAQKRLLTLPTDRKAQTKRHLKLAKLYGLVEQPQQAIEQRQQALALRERPEQGQSYFDYTRGCMGLKTLDNLIDRMNTFWQTTKEDALQLYIQGKQKRAKRSLEKLLRKDPADPSLWALYARCTQNHQAMAHAVHLFSKEGPKKKGFGSSANEVVLFEDATFSWQIIAKQGSKKNVEGEFKLTQQLQEHLKYFPYFDVPRPFAITTADNQFWYVMERAEAITATECLRGNEMPALYKRRVLPSLVSFITKMQGAYMHETLPLRDFSTVALSFSTVDTVSQDLATTFDEVVHAVLPDPTRPTIRDFDRHPENFLITPSRLYIAIDLEDKPWGVNVERDHAKLTNYHRYLDSKQKRKLFDRSSKDLHQTTGVSYDWNEYLKSVVLIALGAYVPLEHQSKKQTQKDLLENGQWATTELYKIFGKRVYIDLLGALHDLDVIS